MQRYPIDKTSFAKREEKILNFWKERAIFKQSLAQRSRAPYFTFYDGPPFATGLPHYGHLLAGTIKDVVPRYKTMKGYLVPRRFGWDCHGLPVEQEIEKSHNLSGKASIESFGIGAFNEACRSIVFRYAKEWQESVLRMGRWVDFEQTYHTMDLTFMESVWWVFKQLYDKGLVYQGFKVMPFSAKLGTPLSNFEAGENYKEVDDPALTVTFPLKGRPNTYFLAWTTTPWTLISNLALMVGPDIEYVKVVQGESAYILAASQVATYFKDPNTYEITEKMLGKKLEGVQYEPLFPYFSDRLAFCVLLEESVSLDEGTGIVHTAPAFGEVDFYACQREGIDLVNPVDDNGKFTQEIPDYEGLFVKEADKAIIKRLKEEKKVFHHGVIRHRYPFCWRSDTPLIYRAMSTWFVAVEKIKAKMLEVSQEIQWTPSHLKEGRFGKWLEGARDWAISRNRYWGTPIPIWKSESGKLKVLGSIAELEALTGNQVTDLHRHFIDQETFTLEGETYQRIDEVFDCWFESGSMPYAQNHYPFENQDFFQEHFPADFIAEGLDQTRGWFYTLTVLSTALFENPAFKNVVVNGIVLAENGAKMSKRLKNYPDPMEVTNQYGADAIRLYMLNSPAVRADDLCFSKQGVELVLRQVLIPLWNAYLFFATYANIYQWEPKASAPAKTYLDRWILSSLHRLIHEVELGMDQYNLQMAVDPLVAFIGRLTNWYIRRSRRRFWSDEASEDRQQAFSTLYQVLLTLSQVIAPFVPFIAEEIFRHLKTEEMPISVHLTDYPVYDPKVRDIDLEEAMEAVQQTVSLGHGLRKEHKLKVRQPLKQAFIASKNTHLLQLLQSKESLIKEELNVKTIHFSEDEGSFVKIQAKPNFRVLGKRVGNKMPLVHQAIQNLDLATLQRGMEGKSITLTLEGEPMEVHPEELTFHRQVKEGVIAGNYQEITIALDPELDEALVLEGLAREIVNKLNTMRRDLGLEVTDRIAVKIDTTAIVQKAFETHASYIQDEVLATSVAFLSTEGVNWDLNGEAATISLEKS